MRADIKTSKNKAAQFANYPDPHNFLLRCFFPKPDWFWGRADHHGFAARVNWHPNLGPAGGNFRVDYRDDCTGALLALT